MSDGVDVVVTLHALATYAESANHWTDDKRMMDASGVADTIYEAMDRIEELEAKLAKAVELALEECPFRCGTPNYDYWWRDYRSTIAELAGGKDAK